MAGNFKKSIVAIASWEPSESPVNAIIFHDHGSIRVNDVLTAMKFWTRYDEPFIEKMMNQNLPEYLEDKFGEASAKLTNHCGINPNDITINGCSLKFPGGQQDITYEAADKKSGNLVHEVRLEQVFLESPQKIPLVLDALGVVPSELTLDLAKTIDPIATIPGLKSSGWTVTNQRAEKVKASHSTGYKIEFERGCISISGFSVRELWGDSPDKQKASLLAQVMLLIGKR